MSLGELWCGEPVTEERDCGPFPYMGIEEERKQGNSPRFSLELN
jgi:hypothetical protein